MDPVKFRAKRGPESFIQEDFIKFFEARGWLVERMVGNAYQLGIPDLYIFHKNHGPRWIDIKYAKKNIYTKAQVQKWPEWEKAGLGIWIIAGTCKHPSYEEMDAEYQLLFEPPNMRRYWKAKYDTMIPTEQDIDTLLDMLDKESE